MPFYSVSGDSNLSKWRLAKVNNSDFAFNVGLRILREVSIICLANQSAQIANYIVCSISKDGKREAVHDLFEH